MSTKAMEIMFKSLGLGEAMAGVDRLIQSGAIDKVVKFADDAEAIKQEICEMRIDIAEIRAMLRGLIHETQSNPDAADGGSANGKFLRTVDETVTVRGQRFELARLGVNRVDE